MKKNNKLTVCDVFHFPKVPYILLTPTRILYPNQYQNIPIQHNDTSMMTSYCWRNDINQEMSETEAFSYSFQIEDMLRIPQRRIA